MIIERSGMKLEKSYPYISENVIAHVNDLIKDLTDFDENRFGFWLEDKKISSKNNPSSYVMSCFKKELDNGKFTKPEAPKIEYVPATTLFFNHLREVGIKVRGEDQFLIDCSFIYLLNNGIISPEELTKLNTQIIDYLLTLPEEKKNSGEYMNLLMKSKTLSGRFIDWNAIGNEAKKLEKEWDDMMSELTSIQ